MKKIIVLLILALSCFACKTTEPPKTQPAKKVKRKARVYKSQKEEKSNWLTAFNSNSEDIGTFYYKDTNFSFNGTFLSPEKKENYLKKLKTMNNSIEDSTILEIHEYDKIKIIEKGIYKSSKNDIFYVTVWEKIRRKWYITYELMQEIQPNSAEKSNLDKSRNIYTNLGTTDNVTKFVHSIFDANGAYFHANEYTINSDNIAKKFEENMANSERFDMNFNSENQFFLSDDYVVDYGKYTVDDYTGNFFFIWKRQENNYWKIHLDLCMF